MGKYSHLDLPKFVNMEEGDHWSKVNELKLAIQEDRKTPAELATKYAEVRAQMDLVKEQKSKLQVELDAYAESISTKFEEEGITSLKLETGASLRVDVKPIPVIRDKEAFRLWCIEKGLQHEMHLHSGTTASMVANLCLVGQPLPDGVDAFMKDTIKYTKAKK